MWIRLKQSYTTKAGKKLPVGRVFNVISSIAKPLINEGIAEPYNGVMPPKKMKTEFFKPKRIKGNGNNRSSNR
jgi:hypothetical protein